MLRLSGGLTACASSGLALPLPGRARARQQIITASWRARTVGEQLGQRTRALGLHAPHDLGKICLPHPARYLHQNIVLQTVEHGGRILGAHALINIDEARETLLLGFVELAEKIVYVRFEAAELCEALVQTPFSREHQFVLRLVLLATRIELLAPLGERLQHLDLGRAQAR